MKKLENVIYSQEKKHSIEINNGVIQILETTDKGFKTVINDGFKNLKENMEKQRNRWVNIEKKLKLYLNIKGNPRPEKYGI